MKRDTHPPYRRIPASCSCGKTFTIGTTLEEDSLQVEICANCHPFYTGKQKLVDTSGRVERFRRKFGGGAKAA